MAKGIPLAQVRTSPDGLLVDGAVRGLYLRTKRPNRYWIYRRTVAGRRYEVCLGSANRITPTAARARATRFAAMTPGEFVEALRPPREPSVKTFEEAYLSWHAWKTANGAYKEGSSSRSTVEGYMRRWVLPSIGRRRLGEVRPKDVARLLSQVIGCRKRVQTIAGAIRSVFAFALAQEWYEGSNPADMQGGLKYLMPNREKCRHFGSLPVEDMPDFFAELLRARRCDSRDALLLAILTASRITMATKAVWEEIDLGARVWRIPPERMKVAENGVHVIPLSDQVTALLESLGPKASGFVFPGRGKGLARAASELWLQQFLEKHPGRWRDVLQEEKLGRPVRLVPHGIARATFRTWAQDDRLGNDRRFTARVAELCLHHATDDQYRGAYERNEMLERRREMLQAWADYCFSAVRR